MASLTLGLAGGFLFGPIGFLVGSLIGNLLFPGKGMDGPRLTNLKPQDSRYGEMIPICYGTVRASGQVIWTTDLQEHGHKHGGKGGPQVTTYTYSASFAVKIAKGPVAALLRIFANGEIVYDTTSTGTADNSQVPVTIYLGNNESDLPDPTMEGILGVGNVPAFRDDFVCVFTDWDFGNFGNTWPQLSFEFATGAGDIPWRVSTFNPFNFPDGQHGGSWLRASGVTYDPATGNITTGVYVNEAGPVMHYLEKVSAIDGTTISTADVVTTFPDSGVPQGVGDSSQAYNWQLMWNADPLGSGAPNGWFYKDAFTYETTGMGLNIQRWGVIATDEGGNQFFIIPNGSGGPGTGPVTISKFTWGGTTPTGTPVQSISLPSHWGSTDVVTSDESDTVYVIYSDAAGTDACLWKLRVSDLSIQQTWTFADVPHSGGTPNLPGPCQGDSIVFYHGYCCVTAGTDPNAHIYLYQVNAPGTPWTQVGPALVARGSAFGLVRFSHGLCMTDEGIISLDPPIEDVTLASIVANISQRCGLTGADDYNVSQFGDYDVSQLSDIVPGYMITSRADGRTDIEQLRTAYFFDAVESNGVIKFVKRGGSSVVTIPDNDLAAQQRGEKPPALVEVKRSQTVDLPTQVNVSFMDLNAAYQKNTQEARRMVTDAFTDSGGPSTVDLAICMDVAKARQVANVNLYGTWIERNALAFRTSRKYDYLEPTDVVTAHGYVARITKKSETVVGVLEFEGVETVPSIYEAAPSSYGGSGYGPPPTNGANVSTALLLLDIPLAVDSDIENGIYAAMNGATTGTWPGANLFKSVDGTTYNQVESEISPGAVVGTVSPALGSFDANNNIVDETNSATVVVGVGGGTLASVTLDQMLNGANEGLIGFELLQWRDAVLTAPSTYLLTGLLRGRRGTEWAISTHQDGETFVAFDPTLARPAAPFGEIGMTEYYKPITFGASSGSLQTFANLANALKPYSPVQLHGGVVTVGGDVQLDWNRRVRIGWRLFWSLALAEPSEQYVVQIWDSTYTLCARYTLVTTNTWTYTAAMQTTDFGATQKHIYFTVGQIGSVSVGGQARGVAPGVGASDGSPLAPITPYAFNPVISPPPPAGGSRPLDHTFSYPAGGAVVVTVTAGSTWVGKFTTAGASPAGHLSIGESAPTPHHAFLATDSGGLNHVANSDQYGDTSSIAWPSPVSLSSTTTYYILIDNNGPDLAPLVTPGTDIQFQILLSPTA